MPSDRIIGRLHIPVVTGTLVLRVPGAIPDGLHAAGGKQLGSGDCADGAVVCRNELAYTQREMRVR